MTGTSPHPTPQGISARKTPCPSCPYRRDVPSGIWDESEYRKLEAYDGDVPDQLAAGATGLFHCHQRTGELCAGWAGCHDMSNTLAVRLHFDRLDPSVLDYESPVPLFGSGAEAAAHGMRDLEAPSGEAHAMARKVRAIQARRELTVTAAPKEGQ